MFNTQLLKAFKSKKVIKIITSLNNLDINSTIRIIKSAELSGATYIDIAANTKIVSLVKSITHLPICVSSISPVELYNCVAMGADLVEIGNFDVFYKKNINFSLFQILQLAQETKLLIPNKDICVTIPNNLNLYQQINLAKELEKIGISIIQTEGCNISNKKNTVIQLNNFLSGLLIKDSLFESLNNAIYSLSSTYALSSSINIPIISASGMDSLSSPLAILFGASGVGIGSNIRKQNKIYDMSSYINEVNYSINIQNTNNFDYDLYMFIRKRFNKILLNNKINF
uniref:Uncharacterized protein ycf23 n=1 Tax=Dictyurus purpurascens TaxID=189649 RepID=A0A4D6WRF1_9FLOR|nr:hypothetical protein [Dictyurus purpurascens]